MNSTQLSSSGSAETSEALSGDNRASQKKTAAGWVKKIARWLILKKLEREWRSSQKFQMECEKLRCHHLVELEIAYRAQLEEKIRRQRLRETA